MKGNKYWRQRFIQIEESQCKKGLQCYADIENQYRKAQKQIEAQIARWYQRFADNNEISMQDARRLLAGKDLAEFKWDVNDYIRHGEENALNQAWMKELENASARYHISRLEALKLQAQQSLEVLFGNQLDSIDSAMKDIYISGYYHTAFEIQKGIGVGWDFATLDDKKISRVIYKPWAADGKNFSERVWGNRQKLVQEMNQTLVQNIILGQDPQKAIDAVAKKMNVSKSSAGRLVMTEEAYFSSVAQKDCFNELDVEQYEIVATLDAVTSEICRSMDGQRYPMKDFEPGVTAPPFHPWCRSTTVPAFDDDFGQIGERAARGEDGKTYYVPADMTYREWKETFVDGGDKLCFNSYKQNGVVHWTRGDETGKIGTMDITKEWTKTKGLKGSVSEKREYIVNGVPYKVDGNHVILHPTEQEREIARVLSEKYGKAVELVPQIMYPQGIQTPDYMIDGDRFDLKSPTGKGKNLIYGLIAKKHKQADNFVVDISDCPLSIEEIEMQIESLYTSPRTGFLEKVILMKGGEILKVYGRK